MSDQIFQPGDKVMLVQGSEGLANVKARPDYPKVEKGVVYCVDFCFYYEYTKRHRVGLIGWPRLYNLSGVLRGFPACCFRKVEEIRLCIDAVKKVEAPAPKEVHASPAP
jgi:hypothetical protein